MTRVALVNLTVPDENLSDCAIRLADRTIALQRVLPRLGLHVDVVDAAAVLQRRPAARAVLAAADVVWWLGRTAHLPETRPLWEAIQALAPHATCADDPDAVEESYDLARFHPLLRSVGAPQPRTRLVPLSSAEVAQDEPTLRATLRRRLRWTWVGRRQVFFRTNYGTRKIHMGLNVATGKDELVERAASTITALRTHQEIGGLVLREVLPIASLWDAGRRYCLNREFRVFVAHGTPVLWSCDQFGSQLRRCLEPSDVEALGALTDAQRRVILASAQAAGRVLRAKLFAVDFAILAGRGDGEASVALLEVNPGHCSGWAHSAAYAGVYGVFLRQLAGLPALPLAALRAAVEEVDLGLWGEGCVFGFLGAESAAQRTTTRQASPPST